MTEQTAKWLHHLAARNSDKVLTEMHKLAQARDFPIVGPEVGRLLAQVARMLSAKRIFELGSGFGYSTLWFARAVGDGGHVWHTDGDPENSEAARRFLSDAGVVDRVSFMVGDAIEQLATVPGEFDIVFCDIDKHQYPDALAAFAERVRVGGAVIIDNLIWSDRVAAGATDADTDGIRRYIDAMWSDSRFVSSLMPVRDGVGLHIRVA